MKRLLIASVAAIGMMLLGISAVQAGEPGCSTPVAAAPAPSGTVAQGQPASGYRTYSYQPTTGYRTYSYQPVMGGMGYRAPSQPGSGFHSAGWKATGGRTP